MNSDIIINNNRKILSKYKVTEKELHYITEYCDNLINKHVPVLFDVFDLCKLFNIEYKEFDKYYQVLYKNSQLIYTKYKIKKKKGNRYRIILSPCKELHSIQKKVLIHILSKIKVAECSKAFNKGNSIVGNAKEHLGSELVINYDLYNFFTNIKFNQVRRVFRDIIGYTDDLSKVLARICCYNGFLPQGAPTSPYISNLVAKELDEELQRIANLNNAKYTRYADDITFSGNKNLLLLKNDIENTIIKNGFIINYKKTNIRFSSQGIKVTGIRISGRKLRVDRELLKKFQQEIYYCKKYGAVNHLKQLGLRKAFFKEHMYGKAYFIKMVDANLGKKLLKELEKVVWER